MSTVEWNEATIKKYIQDQEKLFFDRIFIRYFYVQNSENNHKADYT
ncbi:Protein of unknown function [Bacillus cytotoxicus]|nr:Protein of unknown function [Bacillus cytotoxicus]